MKIETKFDILDEVYCIKKEDSFKKDKCDICCGSGIVIVSDIIKGNNSNISNPRNG